MKYSQSLCPFFWESQEALLFYLFYSADFKYLPSAGDLQRRPRELVSSAVAGLLLIIFSVFLLRLIGYDICGIRALGNNRYIYAPHTCTGANASGRGFILRAPVNESLFTGETYPRKYRVERAPAYFWLCRYRAPTIGAGFTFLATSADRKNSEQAKRPTD